MKTHKYIAALLVLFFGITSIIAQPNNCKKDKCEKFKAMKIGFITEKLKLTTDEAQVFWPVYNEYEAKKQAINSERTKLVDQVKKDSLTLTAKQYEEIADKYVKLSKDESTLIETYHSKFKAVLPSQKLVYLYEAEMQFKAHLLRQMKGGRKNGDKPENEK